MDINVSCPACGAVLRLSETSRRVTCDFCGNHFDVDTTKTEPGLQRITPAEMIADPIPVQSAVTESVIPEPVEIQTPFEPEPAPVLPRAEPLPPYQPAQPSLETPSKRNWTWIIVAIVVGVIACGACSLIGLIRLAQNYM